MDINRLHESIRYSNDRLSKFRKERVEAVRAYVGSHYADNGAIRSEPTNLVELAVTIYLRLLAARAPRCIVKTQLSALRPFAATMEEVLNQIPGEIGLSGTIRAAVMEAMFGIGVVKVGIGQTVDDSKIGDEPFVELVSIDDYFCDMSARSWRECQYEGNDYWMEVDRIREAYGVTLTPDDYSGSSDDGDEQANSISANSAAEVYGPRALLRDVYIVRENRLVTYAVKSMKILRDQPWDGPEGTPYIHLSFSEVPGNLMPLPSSAIWQDLNDLANSLFRKLARQAQQKKRVAAFQGGTDEQITRLRNAKDGEGIRYDGAKPEMIDIGGIDQGNLAFFIQVKDIFNSMAGNLDSLGGLSPQADTATQEKLISDASSARVKDMSDRVVDFAKEIFRRLAWYVWTDPVRERTVHKVADARFGLGVKVKWTPETRDGDFLDYNFDIDVYSMQDDSPASRVQKLLTAFERFVFPAMGELEKQGAYIDMKRVTDYIGKNSNLPELSDFIVFMDQPQTEAAPFGDPTPKVEGGSRKSPYSHRVYERVNRPGATRHGRDAALMQTLLGGKSQKAEMAALSSERTVG